MKITQNSDNSIEVTGIESRELADVIFEAIRAATLKYENTPEKIASRARRH